MAVADAPREVYMFLFVASLVHYIFGMGLFWHRRDKHPVRGHSLTLVTSLGVRFACFFFLLIVSAIFADIFGVGRVRFRFC